MEIKRVFDLLEMQLQKYPKTDALANKVNGSWKTYSTTEYQTIANKISIALVKKGIQKDDKVAIISPNRPEWNFVDIGIQQIGAVSVPIYPTVTVEDYKFIFNDSKAKLVFVANEELYLKAKEASIGVDSIQHIYSFDELKGVSNWKDLIKDVQESEFATLTPLKEAVKSDDLVTLIYTSGTTGTPKGVMLTHGNFVSNVTSCIPLMPIDHTSRAFSFLPLCHVYERMLNYLYLGCGLSVYYAESMDTISDNLKEVHPNMFVTVPRLLEKVYDKIIAKGQELKGIKRLLFFWALELGQRYELDTDLGAWYRFQLKLANKLIFSKWREALGGNVKVIVSGGAALQPRLARVFSAAQIIVMEGYGLTETSPVIAVNRWEEGDRRIGTVGPVIPGVEVKIAEDGEILSRGPHIMKGYYNRPDLTAEAIDKDGWFHTGDIGEFVEGKFLKITDRKKEMFKTSGGKYIAPGLMENKFKESKFIEQIMVVGDGRKFPAALIVPSFAFLKDWCAIKGIEYTTPDQMIKKPEIIARIGQEVEELNNNFAQWEKIKRFELLGKEFTINSGELTPTLKLKRKAILANNAALIEGIYEKAGAMAES
ncbi:MAG: long-chain fatty acid--CoA ligase [Bacteroidota bacterium]|nr:long-chain fatty acid--CoA ligase [Bacteroidota bacterium]